MNGARPGRHGHLRDDRHLGQHAGLAGEGPLEAEIEILGAADRFATLVEDGRRPRGIVPSDAGFQPFGEHADAQERLRVRMTGDATQIVGVVGVGVASF